MAVHSTRLFILRPRFGCFISLFRTWLSFSLVSFILFGLHLIQIFLGICIPLFRSFTIPPQASASSRKTPLPFWYIQPSQFWASASPCSAPCETIKRPHYRLVKPLCPFDTSTPARIGLPRFLAQQPYDTTSCLSIVLWNTFPVSVHPRPASTWAFRVSLLSSLTIPLHGLSIVLWNTFTRFGTSNPARIGLPHFPAQQPCDTTSQLQHRLVEHLYRFGTSSQDNSEHQRLPAQQPPLFQK